MRLADNVFVHDPETSPGQMESERLRANGWSDKVVQQQQRRGRGQTVTDSTLDISGFSAKAE